MRRCRLGVQDLLDAHLAQLAQQCRGRLQREHLLLPRRRRRVQRRLNRCRRRLRLFGFDIRR